VSPVLCTECGQAINHSEFTPNGTAHGVCLIEAGRPTMKFAVVARLTLTVYGPFATITEARAFRKATKAKKHHIVVALVPGDIVAQAQARQAASEEATR
jgi:hypothetical protein